MIDADMTAKAQGDIDDGKREGTGRIDAMRLAAAARVKQETRNLSGCEEEKGKS